MNANLVAHTKVCAGLHISIAGGEFTPLVLGEVNIPVCNDRIIYHHILDALFLQMAEIAVYAAKGQPHHWRLYLAYVGRCWILEPGDPPYALSYLDFPVLEDWLCTGAVISE